MGASQLRSKHTHFRSSVRQSIPLLHAAPPLSPPHLFPPSSLQTCADAAADFALSLCRMGAVVPARITLELPSQCKSDSAVAGDAAESEVGLI